MKLAQGVLRSLTIGLSPQFRCHQFVRALSTTPASGFDANYDKVTVESADDFENRIFGDSQGGSESSFFRKLDRAERAHDGSGVGYNWNSSNGVSLDGFYDSSSTLTDGMDERLKEAATYFEVDEEEIDQDDYKFRPDANFSWGSTYTLKDLDLRRPGVSKPPPRREFEVTTEEVLRKADFRNVRFLANFLTEAGVIIKRSQTKISAKAQRKVAREIKTARAFGLMPFTTMGTKHFAFGRTMEDLDADYEYESYDTHNFVDDAPLDN